MLGRKCFPRALWRRFGRLFGVRGVFWPYAYKVGIGFVCTFGFQLCPFFEALEALGASWASSLRPGTPFLRSLGVPLGLQLGAQGPQKDIQAAPVA